MNEVVVFRLLNLLFRIIFCIIVIRIAKSKNRNTVGWGIFGFCFPIVALIWIACLKVHTNWENVSKENQ